MRTSYGGHNGCGLQDGYAGPTGEDYSGDRYDCAVDTSTGTSNIGLQPSTSGLGNPDSNSR